MKFYRSASVEGSYELINMRNVSRIHVTDDGTEAISCEVHLIDGNSVVLKGEDATDFLDALPI